jgi:hypothetical protein
MGGFENRLGVNRGSLPRRRRATDCARPPARPAERTTDDRSGAQAVRGKHDTVTIARATTEGDPMVWLLRFTTHSPTQSCISTALSPPRRAVGVCCWLFLCVVVWCALLWCCLLWCGVVRSGVVCCGLLWSAVVCRGAVLFVVVCCVAVCCGMVCCAVEWCGVEPLWSVFP